MEVDTGAQCQTFWNRNWRSCLTQRSKQQIQTTKVKLKTCTVEKSPCWEWHKLQSSIENRARNWPCTSSKVMDHAFGSRVATEYLTWVEDYWPSDMYAGCYSHPSTIAIEGIPRNLSTWTGYNEFISSESEDVIPSFYRPRPLPFALKQPVKRELYRIKNAGILRKVSHNEWAAPIVLVPEKGGRMQLCSDCKVMVTQCLDIDQYPLLKSDHLFATLANGKAFSKLELSQAYQ